MVSEIYLLYWICRLNVRFFKLLKKLLTFIIVLLQTFRGGCYWSICKFIVGDKIYDIYKAKPREFFFSLQAYFGRVKAACLCSYSCSRHLWFYDRKIGASRNSNFDSPLFPPLFWSFNMAHLRARRKLTCTAGYAFIVFLLLLLCTFHTNPKETLNDKIKYVYIMTGDRPRLESNGLYSCKWIKRKAISNFPTLPFHIF